MKKILFWFLLLGIPIIAQPITNRPMLGPIVIEPTIRTPIYGIQVNTNGYEIIHPNPISKSETWMTTNGYGNLIPEFDALAHDVEGMLDQIDSLYAEREAAWGICYPGVYSISHRKLIVTVQPAPFNVTGYPSNQWFAGTIQGNSMQVVNLHIHSSGTFLQHYKNQFAWELNNWFACKLISCPATGNDEIRWQNPCN
jgi:hypothetical protein